MGINMRNYSAKDFIKLDDVAEGPLQKTIASIEVGAFDKPDVVFTDGSQLSLNRTSVLALSKVFGWDSESWLGQRVEIYEGSVTYNGNSKTGVMVRPIEDESRPPRPPINADLDDEIPL
jgi:hypothetical protein